MTVERAALERRWIHSHEEDTADTRVFRPDDFAFPPSRGRMGFELRPDGGYVETAIGPTDRPEQVTGTWTLTDADTVVVSAAAEDRIGRQMRVVEVTRDRLVIAKD